MDLLAREPMKLDLKKNRLHDDVGKAPGTKITEADIAKEKAKVVCSPSAHSLSRMQRSGITKIRQSLRPLGGSSKNVRMEKRNARIRIALFRVSKRQEAHA